MFGSKLREAQITIDEQRTMLSQQEKRLDCIKAENTQLSEMLNGVTSERNKLKVQVREQTEADLLMISMKMIRHSRLMVNL